MLLDMLTAFSNPKMAEMMQRIPEFIDQWLASMNRMGASLQRIEMQGDRIESKVQYLIDGGMGITPELHGQVIEMAKHDPRNMKGAIYDNIPGPDAA
jgi:hypothetical protein